MECLLKKRRYLIKVLCIRFMLVWHRQIFHWVASKCFILQEESFEARRFSIIWNEILKTFREEDLISNRFVLLFSQISCRVCMNWESQPLFLFFIISSINFYAFFCWSVVHVNLHFSWPFVWDLMPATRLCFWLFNSYLFSEWMCMNFFCWMRDN